MRKTFAIILLLLISAVGYAQSADENKDVFVDDRGTLRWKGSDKEVRLFGVNYTTPFAYSFRAHKRLSLSLKKAIDLDVAQMARLGFDAYRIHVWDREVSDGSGNLLDNEHLDLFDYLLAKLAEKKIKSIITPIAWWGTGWPEPDMETTGFSTFFSKVELITNREAREAQRNYLKQFMNHVNPYTQYAYKDDSHIIAVEIINEPRHPDNPGMVTEYINEMYDVIRSAGFYKPVFYNISENWSDVQANAVCASKVQGISFQWYPTGLVHNESLRGNYLINVNKYDIPSAKVKNFDNRAKMVYEFDAADIGKSYMYPAMARSFCEAGMQFAAMFSYDPVQIAWSNTEYPTHFVNLLYAPSKAISLMIAGKVFHNVPRMKSYGDYPANNKFDEFMVNCNDDRSTMNSPEEFYYSNSTAEIPIKPERLKHIGGVGNSELVKYEGTGAYFIDKLGTNIWRLEVYPDVLWLRDPFKNTSMSRQVSRLFWKERKIILNFSASDKNLRVFNTDGSEYCKSDNGSFNVKPGSYFVASGDVKLSAIDKLKNDEKFLDGLYTPPAEKLGVYVVNETPRAATEFDSDAFRFKIAADQNFDNAFLYIKRIGWRGFEKHQLKYIGGFNYVMTDSSKSLFSGYVQYCVGIESGEQSFFFPGGIEGKPENWDFYSDNLWNIKFRSPGDDLSLMNVCDDKGKFVFTQFSRSVRFNVDYGNGSDGSNVSLRTSVTFANENFYPFGIQLNIEDKLKRLAESDGNYKYMKMRARCVKDSSTVVKIRLLDAGGGIYGAEAAVVKEWSELKIPLKNFQPSSALVMPIAFPGFFPKSRSSKTEAELKIDKIEFIQFILDPGNLISDKETVEMGIEIESAFLSK